MELQEETTDNTLQQKAGKKVHPEEYTLFYPNFLIDARTTSTQTPGKKDMSVCGLRLLNEVLNINHPEKPGEMTYLIDYRYLTTMQNEESIVKSAKRESKAIRDRMMRSGREFIVPSDLIEGHGKGFETELNIFPAMTAQSNGIVVTLFQDFKKMLAQPSALPGGFTKGDINLLRTFQHEYSFKMYWLIRREQWKLKYKPLRFTVAELKAALGVVGYEEGRFNNFKAKILDKIFDEFKGTWVEFEYKLIRAGKGGREVKEVEIHYKTDREQEKELGLSQTYEFEQKLLQIGITEHDVHVIRHYVNQKHRLKGSYCWNEFFVEKSIEIAVARKAQKDKESRTDKRIKPIKSLKDLLFAAMHEGWWIEDIQAMEKELEKKQPPMPTEEPVQRKRSQDGQNNAGKEPESIKNIVGGVKIPTVPKKPENEPTRLTTGQMRQKYDELVAKGEYTGTWSAFYAQNL